MTLEMREALTDRRDLIEAGAAAQLDTALSDGEPWTGRLGPEPTDAKTARAWRHMAHTVAAYRDRYGIIDAARALSGAQTVPQRGTGA